MSDDMPPWHGRVAAFPAGEGSREAAGRYHRPMTTIHRRRVVIPACVVLGGLEGMTLMSRQHAERDLDRDPCPYCFAVSADADDGAGAEDEFEWVGDDGAAADN